MLYETRTNFQFTPCGINAIEVPTYYKKNFVIPLILNLENDRTEAKTNICQTSPRRACLADICLFHIY